MVKKHLPTEASNVDQDTKAIKVEGLWVWPQFDMVRIAGRSTFLKGPRSPV